jgi:hypothetical protein
MLTPDFELDGRRFHVSEPGPARDDAALAALEAKLGVAVPDKLRSYYRRFNGGLPVPDDVQADSAVAVRATWLPTQAAKRSGAIRSLGAMLQVDSDSMDFWDCWQTFKDRIPSGLLPFQVDPGGSLFLIGTSENNLGRIYFWHSRFQADEDAGELPGYDNIAEVAPSFREYLAGFRDAEIKAGETDEQWLSRNYPG